MKEHVAAEHEGVETQCSYCVKTFVSKEDLRKHEKLIHEEHVNPNAELMCCDQCSYSGYGKFRLKRHIRSVHKMKNIKCKFCDKTYNSTEGLQKHEKLIHPQEINPDSELLFCDQCDYQGYGIWRVSFKKTHAKLSQG